MRIDDIISALKFLNRQQLLLFYGANRFTQRIVEQYFAEWPAIYCDLSLNGCLSSIMTDDDNEFDKENNKFSMELQALNCDCEQQLSINAKELCTYKLCVNLKCKCDINSTWKLWNDKNDDTMEEYEMELYENCLDNWTPLQDPLSSIPAFRKNCEVRSLLDTYSKSDGCCSILAHNVADEKYSHESIYKDYIFEHRTKPMDERELSNCFAFQLRTMNVDKMIDRLKYNFIKIYKLRLQQFLKPDVEWFEENDENNVKQHKQYDEKWLQILNWILTNGKIHKGTDIKIDVDFFDNFFSRNIQNGMINIKQCENLFELIAKCGHLQLTSYDFYWENLQYPDMLKILLKNPMISSIGFGLRFRNYETLKNLLESYNPQNDYRHLFMIERWGREEHSSNLIDYLVNDFINATNENTYFILIQEYFKYNQFKPIYYNSTTNEYLRVSAAIGYSHFEDDFAQQIIVPTYLARYSNLSTMASQDFEYFFTLLEKNVSRRMKLSAEIENNPNKKPIAFRKEELEEDVQLICSFSSFLANAFPTTIDTKNAKRITGELFNGDYTQSFRNFPLPPINFR